jgi:hypothetical protein
MRLLDGGGGMLTDGGGGMLLGEYGSMLLRAYMSFSSRCPTPRGSGAPYPPRSDIGNLPDSRDSGMSSMYYPTGLIHMDRANDLRSSPWRERPR